MAKQLPVIAAIPNFNMGESLRELLPQVLEQGYDAVYVLDDASTDVSREIVQSFEPKVTLIEGAENLGAGGNRNRILEAHQQECMIHFIDADVRLNTTQCATVAAGLFKDPNTAFVGGMVRNKNGKQSIWNFGPDAITLYAQVTGTCQTVLGYIQAPKPLWRMLIRRLYMPLCKDWPDVAVEPKRRAVYWPVEGNLLVRRSVLESLGGFDADIKEFDIARPARRAFERGLVSYFDPSIDVTHLSINVRHYIRPLAIYREHITMIRRYAGWRYWLLPHGHFKPTYNKPEDSHD